MHQNSTFDVNIDKKKLLLLILYLAEKYVDGITRLHKMVFLIQKKLGLNFFRFDAFLFGPWSEDLQDTLNDLIYQGLVEIKKIPVNHTDTGYKRMVFLTEKGAKIAAEVYDKIMKRNPMLALKLSKLVENYNKLPITYLISLIYALYPEVASLSLIKEKVEAWWRYYGLESE